MLIVKGPVVCVGPDHFVSNDPDIIRRILYARTGCSRGPWLGDRQRSSLEEAKNLLDLVTQKGVPEHGVMLNWSSPCGLIYLQ